MREQNPAELLCDHVMRLYGRSLTPKQIPGRRVMLVDLGLPEFPPDHPPELELT